MRPHPKTAAGAPLQGLSDLSWVTLGEASLEAVRHAEQQCGGSPVWRARKFAEYRDFLALGEISAGRLVPLSADLAGPLRLLCQLRCPVATMPEPGGPLVVRDRAMLGVTYPEQAIREPLPGFSFVMIVAPNHVLHPNVAKADPAFRADFGPGQALCLGATIPPSTRVVELILRTFSALTMQSVQLDPKDAAGLMNAEAARWWLANRDRFPLTREGFLPA